MRGRDGKRGHAGVYNRKTEAKVVNQTPKKPAEFLLHGTERKKEMLFNCLYDDLIAITCKAMVSFKANRWRILMLECEIDQLKGGTTQVNYTRVLRK